MSNSPTVKTGTFSTEVLAENSAEVSVSSSVGVSTDVRQPAQSAQPAQVAQPQKDPTSAYRLDGKVAVVTGGGSGIGLAIAQEMVQLGAQVVVVGRRQELIEQTAKDLNQLAGASRVFGFQCDICSPGADQVLLDQVVQAVGKPHILINNAGIHVKASATETSIEDFERVMMTHVTASFALSRTFYEVMQTEDSAHQNGVAARAAGGGSILFISSMAALFGIPFVSGYSAAKTAQVGLVRSLASEFSASGVRVNAIAPGWIDTPMSRRAFEGDPKRLEKVLGRTPMNRLGQTKEIARVAAFISSDAASFMTGAVVPVDGGASIGF